MVDVQQQRDETCQWCGGVIPTGAGACANCGAARPREDVTVPGLTELEQPSPESSTAEPLSEVDEDERRAREILMDLDAYVPEPKAPAPVPRSDPGGDAIVIVGLIAAAAVIGALAGWFLAPPLLHDLFQGTLGVESDGPEAFRRLGAFIGGLVSMLAGATLATIIRR